MACLLLRLEKAEQKNGARSSAAESRSLLLLICIISTFSIMVVKETRLFSRGNSLPVARNLQTYLLYETIETS